MPKIAFLFPGQGAQFLGMGRDLFQEYDFVREIFDAANEIANSNISKLCFEGPFDILTKNINLQPAITAVNLACLSAINMEGISCNVAMGHSLGEYSALKAAQVLSLSDTMRVVVTRGCLMEREANKHRGKMCVLIGLEIKIVESIIEICQVSDVVSIANHNSENQVTISGNTNAVDKVVLASTLMTARAVPLKVSGAWHSNLMVNAGIDFKLFLDTIEFNDPKFEIIYNLNADTSNEKEEIKDLLARQIYSPVLWYNSVCKLAEKGIEIFVEVGPGKVLTGLAKRILPIQYHDKIFNVSNIRSLERFLNAIS